MKKYYEHAGIEIYHGDCREIVPTLGAFASLITDPVWPNASVPLAGSDRPLELLSETLAVTTAERVVIHLGCDSDPRFTAAVPRRWPFIRTCWLRYARPSYKGRILIGADVAYVFGAMPIARPGATVLPGEVCHVATTQGFHKRSKAKGHPCPRRETHVEWLVRWFGGASVLDPFCGSGTTLLACKNQGVPAVGVEIEERFAEIAARRLSQEVFDFTDPATREPGERERDRETGRKA